MSKVKVIKSPFQPLGAQSEVIQDEHRFAVIVAHRRFGKTVCALNKLIISILRCEHRHPIGMYIAPQLKDAMKIIWSYLIEYTKWLPNFLEMKSENTIYFDHPTGTRAKIIVAGADNPMSLKGQYYDFVVFDEVAQMPAIAWTEAVRPALSDRLGGAVFIGTPRGRNIFYDLYNKASKDPEWTSFYFPVSHTKRIGNVTGEVLERELESIKRTMSVEEYEQEYECSWSASFKGSFYGKQLTELSQLKRIGLFPHNPKYKVITAWDLGYDDLTSIWFAQKIDNEIYIIDYYENNRQITEHYINYVLSKPYIYKEHIIPHDAYNKNINSDMSSYQKMIKAGMNVRMAAQEKFHSAVSIVRNFLQICKFNKESCETGLEHLALYEAQDDKELGINEQKAKKSIHNHAADSFRYLAVSVRLSGNDQSWYTNNNFSFVNNVKRSYEYDLFGE